MSEWAARCPACGAGLDRALPIVETPAPRRRIPPLPVMPGPDPVTTRRRRALGAGRRPDHPRRHRGHRRTGRWQRQEPADHRPARRCLALDPPSRSYTLIYTGQNGVEVVPLDGQRASRSAEHRNRATGRNLGRRGLRPRRHRLSAHTPLRRHHPALWSPPTGYFRWCGRAWWAPTAARAPAAARALYVDLERDRSRRSSPSGSFLPATSRWGNSLPWAPAACSAAGRPARAVESSWVRWSHTPPPWSGRSAPAWRGSQPAPVPRTASAPLHVTTSDDSAPGVDQVVQPPPGHEGFLPAGPRTQMAHCIAAFVATSPDQRRHWPSSIPASSTRRSFRTARHRRRPRRRHRPVDARQRLRALLGSGRRHARLCAWLRPGRSASTSRDPAASPWVSGGSDRTSTATGRTTRRPPACDKRHVAAKIVSIGK